MHLDCLIEGIDFYSQTRARDRGRRSQVARSRLEEKAW